MTMCASAFFEIDFIVFQDERLLQTAPYLGHTQRKFVKTAALPSEEASGKIVPYST